MWGLHAIGIAVPLYNRRPRQAFAEVRQLENRKPELIQENICSQQLPTEGIIKPYTFGNKLWRASLVMFAILGIGMFGFAIIALVYR